MSASGLAPSASLHPVNSSTSNRSWASCAGWQVQGFRTRPTRRPLVPIDLGLLQVKHLGMGLRVALKPLQHPNIVAIHEVGEHEGRHYFSMDLVEGEDLAQVTHGQPLPSGRAAQLVQTIAEAIHCAHQRGTLHRDLKPHNVLMDNAGQPHITDFGLAKRLHEDSSLTVSGAVLGSPGYMAPEQAAGRRDQVGPPSDVYSIGAILYYLITGKAPFCAATALETHQKLTVLACVWRGPSNTTPMKTRWRIVLIALLLARLGGWAWLWWPNPDPPFHGKPESLWIKGIAYSGGNEQTLKMMRCGSSRSTFSPHLRMSTPSSINSIQRRNESSCPISFGLSRTPGIRGCGTTPLWLCAIIPKRQKLWGRCS